MCRKIEVFTDGSCLNNPGPGGYGVIIRSYQIERQFSAGYYMTTNNRMELMAAIVALEKLQLYNDVVISTDSRYLQQGITQWIDNWKLLSWKTTKKKPVKNIDLWKRLDILLRKYKISWKWIKGHNGHPYNERCDMLARIAAKNPTLYDSGY